MSNSTSYITEPPTTGRVVLVTSVGELDIELFCKECPKACRNFIGLCYQGYYNQCMFHRVVKNWLVQTGDRTNTGEGGDSIYDHQPFPKELHSRLKFNRRGLVGAASDSDGLNLSQFFITLNRADALTGQHTCFGKLTAETVYNLSHFDIEVDANDRPLNPPTIIRADVIVNPFDDLKPPQPTPNNQSNASKPKSQPKKPVKNTVLSFGDEDEESIAISHVAKPIVTSKNRKAQPIKHESQSSSNQTNASTSEPINDSSITSPHISQSASRNQQSNIPNKVESAEPNSKANKNGSVEKSDGNWAAEAVELDTESHVNAQSSAETAAQLQVKREIAELTSKLFLAGNKDNQPKQSEPVVKVSALDQLRAKYSKPASQGDVMQKLAAFKQKLRAAPTSAESTDETSNNDNSSSWLHHRIAFKKRPQDYQPEPEFVEEGYEQHESSQDRKRSRKD